MTEAQLAVKFIEYFDGFDIYKEVPAGGICDIVVDKGVVRLGIEVKIHLNFEVIQQAIDRKPYFHFVYIAVPIQKRLSDIQKRICKSFGIGILGYTDVKGRSYTGNYPKYEIKEYLSPVLNRKPRPIKLHEYMKRSEAGSQNNRITAFGYFVEGMEDIVRRNPKGIGVKELFDQIEFKHYKTLSTFRSCVVKYCRCDIIKNIDFDSGKFFLKIRQSEDVGLENADCKAIA